MAEKYGMLPSELLEKATTVDLQIHYATGLIKIREQRKAEGKSISDTYSQSEIDEMYSNFKGRNNDI